MASWADAVERAMPARVDLYTISRSTPSAKLRPVSDARLKAIAEQLAPRVDGPVRAFGVEGALA